MASSLFQNQSLFQQPTYPMTQPAYPMVQPSYPTVQPAQQNPNTEDQIIQMWNLVKNSNNQQATMQELINRNPGLKKIMDTINLLGDPKNAFYTLAQQQGKDPNTILNKLK